jgi:D-serine deaminase-like pyridoxal phosphate-dependent protein
VAGLSRPDLEAWSTNLVGAGIGCPRFLIDRQRLGANAAAVTQRASGEGLRLVLKSLPCPALVEHLMARTGTDKLMVFHLPFLIAAAERWPQADLMLGKPLPAAAVEAFYRRSSRLPRFDARRQLHWLIDTPQRARVHAAIARRHDTRLQVVIELDVGMHRGGVGTPDELDAVLGELARAGHRLELTGFMGYDAHAGKRVPWRSRAAAVAAANGRYRALLAHARAAHPELLPERPILNGGGSPTFTAHAGDDSPLTEVAIGSAFVKPAEFDLPQLEAFEPACWIAAPVIKRLRGVRIPFLEWLSPLSRRDTLFIYGGRWPARPCWPPGLRESALYGPSFNQQFMTVPRSAPVSVDEFVFLRPLQSESLMRSLGPVLVLEQGEVVDEWPVLGEAESGVAAGTVEAAEA